MLFGLLALTGPAATQPMAGSSPAAGAPAAAASGTQIILLGTAGGPIMRKVRAQPSSLLVVDGTAYLIDAGDGVVRQLAWAGYSAGEIRDVFLTHLHMDHTQGLASVIGFKSSGAPSRTPLNIFGPPGTELLTKYALDYDSISKAIFAAEGMSGPGAGTPIIAHDIANPGATPTLVYQDPNIRVLAVDNTHYNTVSMPPRSYGVDRSYSYRFETRDRSVVFTGDTGPSEAVTQLAKGADVLVSEVIDVPAAIALIKRQGPLPPPVIDAISAHMAKEHMPADDLGKLASRAGVKLVLLTHFTPGNDAETDPTVYTAGVKKYYSGPVIAGRDLGKY